MVKSNLILHPFFCFISFFALYSNVRWRKVLKRTMMHLHFTFLILSKYDSPIRWALPRLEPRISKFDSAQISLTFSRTSMEVSLSTDGTPSILKQSLRLYCCVSLQEATMALFCFFFFWFAYLLLKETFILTTLVNLTFFEFSTVSLLNVALSSLHLLFISLNFFSI